MWTYLSTSKFTGAFPRLYLQFFFTKFACLTRELAVNPIPLNFTQFFVVSKNGNAQVANDREDYEVDV
jgi:hypothetical protein